MKGCSLFSSTAAVLVLLIVFPFLGCGSSDDCGQECMERCRNTSKPLCVGQEDLGNGMLECHCFTI